MTSRELVYRTLDFANPARVPRDMWLLPWAEDHHKQELNEILRDFPRDIEVAPASLRVPLKTEGDPYVPGLYVDEWGARFTNRHAGVIGEVKEPVITDDSWTDISRVHIPEEELTVDVDAVNSFCRQRDAFVLSPVLARPFERLQFLRGTEQLYMDLVERPSGMMAFVERMHRHHCDNFELWASTEVDALFLMDDWGAQSALLINPATWRELFKPLYADYMDIARRYGKRMFMHSDGHILAIYPDLIELGIDALNSQIFCMGADKLADYAGQITFWGEVDRQWILPMGTEVETRRAVHDVYEALWRDGGCIAQCEFGAGARPENVRAVYEEWDAVLG